MMNRVTVSSRIGLTLLVIGVALLFVFVAAGAAAAQLPTGAIVGVVTDASDAVMVGVQVTIINRNTGQARTLVTSTDGTYGAAALAPAVYRVTAEAAGFKRSEREADVEAGTTTAVDLKLALGEINETVTVARAAPLLHYDDHLVGGVVTREQIETLPLNGRNFLDLAKLEPGVTGPTRGTNNRVFVPMLGAGLQTMPRIGSTRITVDGADIAALGTIGAALQVSQEVVQEFQISTVNFDPATSLTTNGAINIVTRSGGNEYRGGGFFFYRDHNLAAYPGLRRDSHNPDPFFERRQFGATSGGPIVRDRAFFFASYERNDQRGVVSVQPNTPDFAALGGIVPNPYLGNQFSARVDGRLRPGQNAFVRYTHDGNRAFGPNSGAGTQPSTLPSGWSRVTNEVDQSLAGLTSVVSSNLVNDLRLSYFFADSPEQPAGPQDCPGCLGLGASRITIPDAGIALGKARALTFVGRRYQVTDSLVWQRGSHRVGVGVDWEHALSSSSTVDSDPAQITLWSPNRVRLLDPSISLPASFTTLDDILRLPLQTFQATVGSPVNLQHDFHANRVLDLYRLYVSDTWRARSGLSVNAGLGWSYEPNALNYYLAKPPLLVPILGPNGLNPPAVQARNLSPTIGFAWTVTRDGRTVVRAGAGRYFDPIGTNSTNLANERLALFPRGTGRLTVSGSNIPFNARSLDFPARPTSFTGADLLSILPGIRDSVLGSLDPSNRDFSIRNIDQTKEGLNLSDPSYATPYATHVNVGVQRELAHNLVVDAEFVWRQFVHTFILGVDYNRWNSARGAVLPPCTQQQRNDVHLVCSNGPITFDNTVGRARYEGLLLRVNKRFSGRAQVLASYAMASYVGTNGTGAGTGFNNDNWVENYGPLPTDYRHELNLSGFVQLPRQFQVAFNVSASSAPPFSAYVSGIDFNGDGTRSDLLPGTTVNQFRRGLSKDDLARRVQLYNQQLARHLTASGQLAPPLTLPADYSFNESFFTQDIRFTRTFGFARARLLLFAEVFNLFNTPNLVDYSGNLGNPATFGQPGARFTQVFGSGGPRAFQAGTRVSF